ncbi:hydroxysqualene dehydroxylase [Massilia agri]|uniref:FAD-dependent oxidoreductase n=1 Tax=Massilia agri TaxID=1886785 RepID=A0ABT2ANM3_9BURK|nr:FAD-dependent oxidoreductase [Massilia agri]MCS0597852.1 FAD-dependent oxidoreductase [Massilia agri]
MTQVTVVGAGLAGLACAVALADHGIAVTVVERNTRLGGRASSWREPVTGDVVDIGPHIFHSEYHNMLAFLARLGTKDLICWQPGKVLTVASKPRPTVLRHWPLPAPLSLMPSILQAPGLDAADYLSMAGVGWRGMRFGEEQVPELDRISALDFLRGHGVSERMIDWWWRFAAMVVTNVPLQRCSAASLMRIHAQLSGYRGLHFGFARVGLGELYTRQAVRAIERAGGRVLKGRGVAWLSGRERVDGVVLSDGSHIRAEQVVSALPPQDLDGVLPRAWRGRAPFDALPRVEPSPYVCCYLWFDRDIKAERFASNLFAPDRLNYDFYDLCQIRQGWRGRPTVIASNIIYSHRAHGLTDAEIVRRTVMELGEIAPRAARARLLHADVHRVPMAIPCPLVGFERMRPRARSPIPGLTLAGDWTRTHMPCTMEGAAKSGFMAAEVVLAERGLQANLAIDARLYDDFAGLARAAVPGRTLP